MAHNLTDTQALAAHTQFADTYGYCPSCQRPFDTTDPRLTGRGRFLSTPWCGECHAACGAALAADETHICVVCDPGWEIPPASPEWTITQVTEHLGAASTGSARRTLSRWGVRPVGRRPGRSGESLYSATQVQAAHAARPGRGHRTDLAD